MRTLIEIVKDDSLYDLNFTCQTAEGAVLNLTNASALLFKAQKSGDTELKVTGNMQVVSAAAGTCKYQVQAEDFDEAGTYNGEIEITFTDGQVITFTDIVIKVKEDLPK